ncbi:hypothetical protein [Paramuribaculum intestinale]|jgi:hypothetical protein|uniref:hypothetical protein n=1 Tax=Paramuribaculum intestinale TaxID=2094151 RepID=UPI0023BDAADD|nr:hypothetical protein [Paramuribaculum intestinale]MDE6927369.1 hypothetical protein [Muribaculaceae bacterium]
MNEKDEIKLFDDIREGILEAQREMLMRKAKLGELVVVADENGVPYSISADEALRLLDKSSFDKLSRRCHPA